LPTLLSTDALLQQACVRRRLYGMYDHCGIVAKRCVLEQKLLLTIESL